MATTTTTKSGSSGDQRRIHQRHPHPQRLKEQRAALPQNMWPFRMKAVCLCLRISFKTSGLFNQLWIMGFEWPRSLETPFLCTESRTILWNQSNKKLSSNLCIDAAVAADTCRFVVTGAESGDREKKSMHVKKVFLFDSFFFCRSVQFSVPARMAKFHHCQWSSLLSMAVARQLHKRLCCQDVGLVQVCLNCEWRWWY